MGLKMSKFKKGDVVKVKNSQHGLPFFLEPGVVLHEDRLYAIVKVNSFSHTYQLHTDEKEHNGWIESWFELVCKRKDLSKLERLIYRVK